MILESAELKETAIWWILRMRRSGFIIYWFTIGLFLTGFTSLFFIHVDITVRANGIIRPFRERTNIKSPVSGLIDTLYFNEGEHVTKNSILIRFLDPALNEKQRLIEIEISRYKYFIHDLDLLTSSAGISVHLIPILYSPLYKQEVLRFFSRSDEQKVILAKANHEASLNEKLVHAKVISPKEFYDIRIQQRKTVSAYQTFQREQLANWQADLVKYKSALEQCFSRQKELDQLYETERIRAPVSGCLQQLNGHYSGNFIQAGEMICSISPDGSLIGECYVLSKDIGFLKRGQLVQFQLDAFNYNYFGMVTGNIYFIDNDFMFLDKMPVFKVRCHLNDFNLKLSNGYTGVLKKGMSFQARIKTCNRTLWQLLYDGLDDWLNPAHQPIFKTS